MTTLDRRRQIGLALAVLVAGGAVAGLTLGLGAHGSSPGDTDTETSPRVLFASLVDVACLTETHCVAVGDDLPLDEDADADDRAVGNPDAGDPDGDGQATHALAEASNGVRWRLLEVPDRGEGGTALNGVACPTATECVAVGYFRPGSVADTSESAPPSYPIIATLSGDRWRIDASPRVPENTVLDGIACPTRSMCVAVGDTATGLRANTPVEVPFAESDTGGSWQAVPVPHARGTSAELNAVACASVDACVAVGDTAPTGDPTATRPLLDVLSHGQWHVAALPVSAEGPGTLDDVACSPSGPCTAVGTTSAVRASGAALVLTSTGSGWAVNRAALAAEGDILLKTVTCPVRGSCLVTGDYWPTIVTAPEAVIARVGATTWYPVAITANNEDIEDVACPAVTRCLGVGSVPQNRFGNTNALVATLSGTAWRTEPSPVP